MSDSDIEKIIERLREIDTEIASLFVTRTKTVHNSLLGTFRTQIRKVIKDPYRIRVLRNEKQVLLDKLDQLSKQAVENKFPVNQLARTASADEQALEWGVEKYMMLKQPHNRSAVKKSRSIARQAIDLFFRELDSEARNAKIDAMRDRISEGVKKRLSNKP